MRSLIGILVLVGATSAQGAEGGGPIDLVRDVSIAQRLDAQLPLEAEFTDEEGRAVRFGDYFTTRPVVLALVYYECPMLCTQVLNGLLEAMRPMPLELGTDFEVVTVSIDPLESPALAKRKKANYLAEYRGKDARVGDDTAWHALTGSEASIAQVAEAIGFRYRYDPEIDEYAHAAAIYVATPDGRLARYFFGIEYAPRDLRLALVEASDGKVGGLAEALMMLCYHYDPLTGKYGFAVMSVVRVLGILTVCGIVAFMFVSLRREKRARALNPRPTIG